jgi:peptide subunit release factor 1 (eRF1)
VHLNAARLFVTSRGLLREVRGLYDDPKFYHKVRRTGGLSQKRYQRHADLRRMQFAKETAERIERLVEHEQPIQVILAGEEVAVSLVRQALPPHILSLVQEQPVHWDRDASPGMLLEEIEPLLRAVEAEQDRSVVERLVEEVQADGLGVCGLAPTRTALEQGQADILVLAEDVPFPPQTRSNLIDLALSTGARVEVVEQNATLRQLGGVGALLRYRLPEAAETGAPVVSDKVLPDQQPLA